MTDPMLAAKLETMGSQFATVRSGIRKEDEMTTGSETLDRIVERLRSRKENVYDYASQGAEWQDDKLCGEAADEIERLMYELEASAKLELAEKIRADNLEVELAECWAERKQENEACAKVADAYEALINGMLDCVIETNDGGFKRLRDAFPTYQGRAWDEVLAAIRARSEDAP
jgi:hypothetical protein